MFLQVNLGNIYHSVGSTSAEVEHKANLVHVDTGHVDPLELTVIISGELYSFCHVEHIVIVTAARKHKLHGHAGMVGGRVHHDAEVILLFCRCGHVGVEFHLSLPLVGGGFGK